MRTGSGLLVAVAAGAAVFAGGAWAQLAPGFDAALTAEARPAEEKERDASRKPAEVLNFVGIGAGMTVVEGFAGGGWYTEVLSAAVGPEGTVYAQNPVRVRERVEAAAAARAERLGNVQLVYTEGSAIDLPEQVDAGFTALNLHDYANRSEEAALEFLGGLYDALRPGGVLGIVDHVGIAGQDNGELHRIETSRARDLIARAGFAIEAESDILMNPDDDHTLGIRDPAIRSATDRMLIRARKPE